MTKRKSQEISVENMKLEQARIETNDVYSIQRHCYRIHRRNHAIPRPLLEGSIQFSNQLRATSRRETRSAPIRRVTE